MKLYLFLSLALLTGGCTISTMNASNQMPINNRGQNVFTPQQWFDFCNKMLAKQAATQKFHPKVFTGVSLQTRQIWWNLFLKEHQATNLLNQQQTDPSQNVTQITQNSHSTSSDSLTESNQTAFVQLYNGLFKASPITKEILMKKLPQKKDQGEFLEKLKNIAHSCKNNSKIKPSKVKNSKIKTAKKKKMKEALKTQSYRSNYGLGSVYRPGISAEDAKEFIKILNSWPDANNTNSTDSTISPASPEDESSNSSASPSEDDALLLLDFANELVEKEDLKKNAQLLYDCYNLAKTGGQN